MFGWLKSKPRNLNWEMVGIQKRAYIKVVVSAPSLGKAVTELEADYPGIVLLSGREQVVPYFG